MRYSGPLVSSMIATGMFNRWRTRLIISMRRRCSAWLPWEKFSRATFIPAMHICVIVSSFSQAGPMVHTIFVLRICVSS